MTGQLSRRLGTHRGKFGVLHGWSARVGHMLDLALDALDKTTQGLPQLHQHTHLQGGGDPFPAPGTPSTIDPNLPASAGTATNYARSDVRPAIDLKLTAKGDSLTLSAPGTYVREAVGANETLHVADSAQTTGRRWATLVSLLAAILTTKGDILIRNSTTVARKAVGQDGLPLYADSAHADGIKYGPKAIRPAQITASVNDYAPGHCTVLFLNADAAWNITGLLAGTVDGEERLIINNGAFALTLTHADGSSAAANQFLCQGAVNITLNGGFMARLSYDLTATAWRAVGL